MSSAPKADPTEQPNRWQDLLAGLSIAGLLLPEAVAYSSIAALAPQPHCDRLFIWRRDRLLVICAVAAVLVLGVLDGLLVAVAISVLLMLKQMSAADIQILGRIDGGHDFVDLQRHPAAQVVPGV